ncbi:MAG: hypothetical protein JSR37_04165 [Verrucomicrobia bacterium]|nr:hypothetical protein [Verrucomicrobiota bacterium]MBS0635990.1 hypothetical protein [Verrucomicrobiota bacterium]
MSFSLMRTNSETYSRLDEFVLERDQPTCYPQPLLSPIPTRARADVPLVTLFRKAVTERSVVGEKV